MIINIFIYLIIYVFSGVLVVWGWHILNFEYIYIKYDYTNIKIHFILM